MKKGALIPLIVGGSILTFVGVMASLSALKNYFTPLIEKEYILEEYNNIDIDISTADLEFKTATDGINKVVVYEKEKEHHNVEVKDDTLLITSINEKEWYDYAFNFDFRKMDVIVYTTKDTFNNISINSSTGFIHLNEGYTINNLYLKASTGNINVISNVLGEFNAEVSTGNIVVETHSKSMSLRASTGNVLVVDSLIEEKLDIHTSTGHVTLLDSDASSLDVSTSTGNVDMTLLSDKEYDVSTSTGKIHIPSSVFGAGKCKVNTSTGDIKISIKNS